MFRVRHESRLSRWGLLALFALAACEKKTESDSTVASDAGADDGGKVSALDPELAEAMAAAKMGAASPPPTADGGPPPNGIFAPGAADKEAAKGAPPRMVVGSEGNDPKLSLRPAQLAPASKIAGTIQISVQQGQQAGGIPIEFGLELSAQKPKEGEGPAGASKVSVKVTSAKVPVAGVGNEVEKLVGKLKGARISYFVTPDGAGTGYALELPKGAPSDIATWIENLKETLALVALPVPEKPVGVGAYWMVTSREGVLGLDLVTYRLVKVEAIKDGVATLSVNTKRYSASPTLDLPGLPPNVDRQMSEFQAVSEARLEYKPGAGLPVGGNVNAVLAAGLGPAELPAAGPPGAPPQRAMQGIMLQSRATLSFAK